MNVAGMIGGVLIVLAGSLAVAAQPQVRLAMYVSRGEIQAGQSFESVIEVKNESTMPVHFLETPSYNFQVIGGGRDAAPTTRVSGGAAASDLGGPFAFRITTTVPYKPGMALPVCIGNGRDRIIDVGPGETRFIKLSIPASCVVLGRNSLTVSAMTQRGPVATSESTVITVVDTKK